MKQPYISLFTQGLGKIIVGNKESNIISFPTTFKNGDIVDVKFKNNDINNDIINLTAYSKDYYYGFVISKFSSYKGIILITYPEIDGTILFKSDLDENSKVKFKIKKLFNGNIEAVDIQNVSKNELFKANIPVFGKIKKDIIIPKEGVIEEVVLEKKYTEGIVKVIKLDRNFGFISSEMGDFYFKINLFEQIYGKTPQEGDNVKFTTQRFGSKISVKSFIKNISLKESLQYGIVDGKKFTIKEYKKTFNKVPQLGDIVYYTDKDKVEFKDSDTPIVNYIFQEDKNFLNVKSGKISFIKNSFGFIKSNNDSIYFLIKNYKKFYNKEPQKGETVNFIYEKTEKGFQVKKFIFQDVELNVKNFKNFINIDPLKIYYAYKNANQIDEVYEYRSENLNQSISCYKSTKDSIKKLEAIECMQNYNYSSQKITKEKLKYDKIKLLDKLVQDNLNNRNYQNALYYENKYQQEKFDISRLKQLSQITQKHIHFIEKIKINKVSNNSSYVNFINRVEKLKVVKLANPINIIQSVELKQPIQPKQTYKFITKGLK